MVEKYYTEEGLKALNNRLKTLIELYKKEGISYPSIYKMFGFPPLVIYGKEHHEGMIHDLLQILNKNDKVKFR